MPLSNWKWEARIRSLYASALSAERVPSLRYRIIGNIHVVLNVMGFTVSSSVEGLPWISTKPSISTPDDANLARRSTASFSSLGIWSNSTFLNYVSRFLTTVKYFFILSSLASYSPLTCPTINWESLLTVRFLIPILLDNFSPARRASYSASLLVARKRSWSAYSNCLSQGRRG